jgi:hypothetical protein
MPERAKDELEVFTGNSNPALARAPAQALCTFGDPHGPAFLRRPRVFPRTHI